jgi:hypothetical protein
MRAGPDRHLARLPGHLRASAKVFANGEVAWPNEHAEIAINGLADAGHRILGLDARTIYSDGALIEVPVSAWSESSQGPRGEQIEQCRREALAALPLALAEGDFVLITWD